MDADTGELLYARHPDEPGLMASTTKIMTGLLVSRRDPDQILTVPREAVGAEGSSLYLKEGERLTRRELLLGLMLQSGNDAALALAICDAGSEAAFVTRMNAQARALGLENTHYANPHGLDQEGNYSSARDLALLMAKALEEPLFREAAATKSAVIAGDRALTNHNKLLWTCPGCIGGKTGYTKAAGRLLVSAAQRQGRTLICVTVNDPADWKDHRALYDWAFAQYRPRCIAREGRPVEGLGNTFSSGNAFSENPHSGNPGSVLVAGGDLTLWLRPEEQPRLKFLPGLASDLLPGQAAGELRVYLNGEEAGRVPLRWGEPTANP